MHNTKKYILGYNTRLFLPQFHYNAYTDVLYYVVYYKVIIIISTNLPTVLSDNDHHFFL